MQKIFEEVAKKIGFLKDKENAYTLKAKDVKKIFTCFQECLLETMKTSKEKIRITNLFTIKPIIVSSRSGTNPKTKQKIKIPEHKTILFETSKKLIEKINEENNQNNINQNTSQDEKKNKE